MPRFQTYRYTVDKTTSSIYLPSTLLTADDVVIWAHLERTVLSYQGESGGSSVARKAKYTVKLSYGIYPYALSFVLYLQAHVNPNPCIIRTTGLG